jgi:aminopeptidase
VGKDRLQAYAELTVRVGANVAEGQYVLVMGLVEHAPLVRAVTEAAYDAGAEFVDVWYQDQHTRRSLIAKGPDAALEFTPEWAVHRLAELGERHGAMI